MKYYYKYIELDGSEELEEQHDQFEEESIADYVFNEKKGCKTICIRLLSNDGIYVFSNTEKDDNKTVAIFKRK